MNLKVCSESLMTDLTGVLPFAVMLTSSTGSWYLAHVLQRDTLLKFNRGNPGS